MTIYHHSLTGCSPTPLANYLKALGVLRTIGEQLDPSCRGWWQDEQFHLLTDKSKTEIEHFFLEKYEPSPFVSPWNKGCGFFKADDAGLAPLENSNAARFARFRDGIKAARELLNEISNADATIRAIKARSKTNRSFQTSEQRLLLRNSLVVHQTVSAIEISLSKTDTSSKEAEELRLELHTIQQILSDAKSIPTKAEADQLKRSSGYKKLLAAAERRFKTLKEALITDCKKLWRGPTAQWLACAVVLNEDGSPDWPSLLGTGGNDGNLDFTNNFMQRLGDLFDIQSAEGSAKPSTCRLLQEAFWRVPTNDLNSASIGQFQPGSAGGPNSSTGVAGGSCVNPWDFVLMLEGTILFSAKVTRRLSPKGAERASAPFVVRSHAAGYASTGSEKSQRGEQWMPLWDRPSSLPDLRALFGEARIQLGRQVAARPIEAACALSRLGTARGIVSFVRYGYLERNGQSNLAVPLGRFDVREHPLTHLLDNLSIWADRIHARSRDSYATNTLKNAEKNLADKILNLLAKDDPKNSDPALWQSVLQAALDIECIQKNGVAIAAGPIPPLHPQWLRAIDDGSVELRLAIALASAAAGYTRKGWPIDSIRGHWLPLKGIRFLRFNTSKNRLLNDPRVVMTGKDFLSDCAAVIERRFFEAERGSQQRLQLSAHAACGARLSDIGEFLHGELDDAKLYSLARALMPLRWDLLRPEHLPISMQKPRNNPSANRAEHTRTTNRSRNQSTPWSLPEESWLILRLAHLPGPLKDGRSIATDSSIVKLLQSGLAGRAVEIAIRRLRSAGLRPPLYFSNASEEVAKRWAAALVFPLSPRSIQRAAVIVDPSLKGTVNA